jgi:putative oxidoreductase
MNQTNASNPTNVFAFVGRLLIAALFILGGLGKLAAPEATQGYIASVGLPAPLLGLAVAVIVEAGGGLLLLIGYRARLVSLVLAAFTLILAAIFHKNFADQNQMIHFLKNIAIVGGLLQIAAFGAGSFSLDGRRLRA